MLVSFFRNKQQYHLLKGFTCIKEGQHVSQEKGAQPNAKAYGIQWDHFDAGLAPSRATVGQHGFCEDTTGIGADGRETGCEQSVGQGCGARRISSNKGGFQQLAQGRA